MPPRVGARGVNSKEGIVRLQPGPTSLIRGGGRRSWRQRRIWPRDSRTIAFQEIYGSPIGTLCSQDSRVDRDLVLGVVQLLADSMVVLAEGSEIQGMGEELIDALAETDEARQRLLRCTSSLYSGSRS